VNQPSASLRILALETSAEHCSVALRSGEDTLWRLEPARNTHSELLLPMIDQLLRDTGTQLAALDAVAFGAGPGSFTGLRIACGVAQGLAYPVGCRCVPVGSLEALAEASGGSRVVVCTDARMGQVYHGAFVRDGSRWREVMAPSLCHPESLPPLPDGDWLGCGNGFECYAGIMQGPYGDQLTHVRNDVLPHAREIALLGAYYLEDGRGLPASQAAPLYVRNKVALTMKEQR
jgi:tRNA threonylcarbamoyladenosine biosynthesis protein TsaB